MQALIIDSSRSVVFALSALFADHGIQCHAASCGQEALQLLESTPIDLLCSAYELGDMNGSEFLTYAKANKLIHHQPVIMFTSTNRKEIISQALQAGVTECFMKRDLARLEKFIEKFTANRKARLEGKVLLVEDSATMTLYYRQIMERMGLTVDSCTTAEAAIEKFAKGTYDLVVTDYVLEGAQTGFSVIRAVRESAEKKSRTPILAISAFDDMARRVEILRNGANDFVGKPVVAEELDVRISNLLGMQKLMRRLEHQHQTMREMAMRDQLTSLYNRHFLSEELPMLIADAHENRQALSLLVIDLDHFKQINDTGGHKAGDLVLVQIAKSLQQQMGEEDLLGRVGGEEFVCILPRAGLTDAVIKADAIRRAIQTLQPCGIEITVSIGIATLQSAESYDDLFRRADSALYRAKITGRNRVEAAT